MPYDSRGRYYPPTIQPAEVGMIGVNTPDSSGYHYDPNRILGRRVPNEQYVTDQIRDTFSQTFWLSAANGSTLVVPANPNRIYLLIQNLDAAANAYFNIGKDALPSDGCRIIPGGNYLEDVNCPQGDVYLYGDNALAAIQLFVMSQIRTPPTVG